MKRMTIILLVALASAAPGPADAAARSIQVANFAFAPASLQANPGDTLNWTWSNGFHTVTAYRGGSFASGAHPIPFSYQQTYNGGALLYRCEIHSSLDAGGNCNGMCGVVTPVDTVPPPPPDITSPLNGASLADGNVLLQGTAGDDAVTVRLVENGGELARPAVTDHAWSAALAFGLGQHVVTATASDASGNTSAPTSVSFTIADLTPPPAPDIFAPLDGEAFAVFGITVHGGASIDTKTVRVSEDHAILDTAAVLNGDWTMNHPFPEGRHTITATALDGAGNESAPSDPVSFLVDVTAPRIVMLAPRSLEIVVGTLNVAGEATDNFTVASVVVHTIDQITSVTHDVAARCPACGSSSTPWSAALETGPGIFSVLATAYDEVGHQGSTSAVTVIVL